MSKINIKDLLEKHKGKQFKVLLNNYKQYLTLREKLPTLGLITYEYEPLTLDVFKEPYPREKHNKKCMNISVLYNEFSLMNYNFDDNTYYYKDIYIEEVEK